MTPSGNLRMWQWEKAQRRLSWALAPFGRVYGAIMAGRRKSYALGRRPAAMPHAPCVCVGNIAMGGSGKTPLVSWLMEWGVEHELRPCVLTRGYGGRPPRLPFMVTPSSSWQESGDEPLMLARRFSEHAHILVDPDRSRAVEFARKHLAAKMFIMDDGLQHLRLHRHIDLIVLRLADFTTHWGRVLPSGPWREGPEALRAGAAYLVKAEPENFLEHTPVIRQRMERFKRPVFSYSLQPQGLYSVQDNSPLISMPESSYVFMSGLGDNQQALATVERYMQRPSVEALRFRDHQAYTTSDLELVNRVREHHNAGMVICTEKDAVKLSRSAPSWLYCLRVTLDFGPSLFADSTFPEWWENRWKYQPHVPGR